MPRINGEWVRALEVAANTHQGLHIIDEDESSGTHETRKS